MDYTLAKTGKASWEEMKPSESPLTRSSHGVSYNLADSSVYVWGGENIARHSIDSELWKFSGEWTQVVTTGTKPSSRVAHAQIIQNNVLWVWGGRQGEEMGDGDLDDLFRIDLSTLVWEHLTAKGDLPVKRSFHQMSQTPGKLHLFGGCSGPDRLAELHTLDLETLEWSLQPKNEGMKGVGGAGFVSHGENLFVVAGFDGDECNDCYKFNITTKTWTKIPSDNLRPRSVFGICTVGNHIIVLGGELEQSNVGHLGAGDFGDDLVTLNVETLQFGELEQNLRPVGRGWTRLTESGNNSFVLFGGLAGNDEKPERLNDTWRCNLEF